MAEPDDARVCLCLRRSDFTFIAVCSQVIFRYHLNASKTRRELWAHRYCSNLPNAWSLGMESVSRDVINLILMSIKS